MWRSRTRDGWMPDQRRSNRHASRSYQLRSLNFDQPGSDSASPETADAWIAAWESRAAG
jgi:hypothetical protein